MSQQWSMIRPLKTEVFTKRCWIQFRPTTVAKSSIKAGLNEVVVARSSPRQAIKLPSHRGGPPCFSSLSSKSLKSPVTKQSASLPAPRDEWTPKLPGRHDPSMIAGDLHLNQLVGQCSG
ncbi:hypothetical protein Rs2_16003 [Raphanus sativus]|nr:hypothetical protein Rs2_16003 [Raphanus sativus]